MRAARFSEPYAAPTPSQGNTQVASSSIHRRLLRRHGIDPLAYLRDVLTRLPAMTNQDDLTLLLTSKWSPPPLAPTSADP